MAGRVRTAPLALRHLRAASGGPAVAALVLALATLAAATHLALTLLGDATVRDRLTLLSPTESAVQATAGGAPSLIPLEQGEVPETSASWDGFTAALARIRDDADAPLPELLGEGRVETRSLDNPVVGLVSTQAVTIVLDPSLEAQLVLVDGRMPEATPVHPEPEDAPALGAPIDTTGFAIDPLTGMPIDPASGLPVDPTTGFLFDPSTGRVIDPATGLVVPPVVPEPPVVEGVLSVATAEAMAWAIGETRTIGSGPLEAEVRLVGTVEARDAADPSWQLVTSVLEPAVFDDGNAPRRVTAGLIAHPAMLPVVERLPGRVETTAWFSPDVARIDTAGAADTEAALRRLTAVGQDVGGTAEQFGILSMRFTTELAGAIGLGRAQVAATAGVLAMVLAGPVGVATAVLALSCRLVLERRRAALRLLSSRGASTGQLRGLLGIEGALIGLLPAALGAAGVWLLAPSIGASPEPSWLVAPAIVGLAPLGILVALATTAAERRTRTDLGLRRPRWRRVAELATLVLAAASVALLLVRGPSAGGVDPLVAAAPLLLAIVACLITLRLYPLPLRSAVERGRRQPGLTGFLGAARALREPSIGPLPVLALLVGVAVAVTSAVLLSTVDRGVEQSVRGQVGADLRVAGATFTPEQREALAAIDGVETVAWLSNPEAVEVQADGQRSPGTLVVTDGALLRQAQGDGPGLLPTGVALDGTAEPMAIVLGPTTAARIGDAAAISIEGVDAQVVGVGTGATPLGTRQDWIAIDAAHAEAVLGTDRIAHTLLLGLEPGADPAAVEDAVASTVGVPLRIEGTAQLLDRLADAPAVSGVRIALLAATALAALLSALAIAMTLALTAAPRARVLALLRTLGAPRGTGARLLLWEIGPPALGAIIGGGAFGALVPLVVLAAVDLRPFTAAVVQPGYAVDPATIALTLGGFALLTLAATAAALLLGRGGRIASALATVEEG